MLREFLESFETSGLSDLLNDIWIEDERRESLNDLERSDIIDGIAEWVEDGIQHKSWTLQEWIDDVKEAYGLG